MHLHRVITCLQASGLCSSKFLGMTRRSVETYHWIQDYKGSDWVGSTGAAPPKQWPQLSIYSDWSKLRQWGGRGELKEWLKVLHALANE